MPPYVLKSGGRFKGKCQKGEVRNPFGRPRKPEIEELRFAMEQARLKNNKSFLQHFVERAYKSDPCAIALCKKILPDKIEDMTAREYVRTYLVLPSAAPIEVLVLPEKLSEPKLIQNDPNNH